MKKKKLKIRKSIKWLLATIILIIAINIYNHFGHGVYAWQMNFAWVPSALIFVVTLLQEILRNNFLKTRTWYLINFATWMITVGLIITGIFLIAGTGSKYIQFYFYLGSVLLIIGFVRQNTSIKNNKEQIVPKNINPVFSESQTVKSSNPSFTHPQINQQKTSQNQINSESENTRFY